MKKMGNLTKVAALSIAMVLPTIAQASDTDMPGIVTSLGTSATVSTKEIVPGGDMWAGYFTLPPGRKVEFAKLISKWTDFEFNLKGSATGAFSVPPGTCLTYNAAMRADGANLETVSKPGDAVVCNYARLGPGWEENRGSEPFVKAVLNIGGPNTPEDIHATPNYAGGGGSVSGHAIARDDFAPIEKELIAAGAMTASIRQVTVPAGMRIVVRDHYPVLRMVSEGGLEWGEIPADADPQTKPDSERPKRRFDWIGWVPKSQIVIINRLDTPAQFIEWSVVPAPGVTP